ncbi:hypothetical protein JCM11491_000490 [Sporobolomyces phaffii]
MVHIPDNWHWYGYRVNEPLSIVAAVLFALVSALLSWRMVQGRTYYTWPIVLGALFEVVGFILRRFSASNPTGGGIAMDLYISSTVFLVLAPAFVAAGVYVTFGRLIRAVGPEYSRLTRAVARTFVLLDVTSIVLQATGMSLYGSSSVSGRAGPIKALLISGFAVQLASFATFLAISVDYHFQARAHAERGEWEKLSCALCIVDVLLLVRSVYRCVEYSTTTLNGGTLREHEAFFYCLDSLLIFASCIIVTLWHPSRYLRPSREALGSREEKSSSSQWGDETHSRNLV